MLFSELHKIMVNTVTFAGFRGSDRPNRTPLDPQLNLYALRYIKMTLSNEAEEAMLPPKQTWEDFYWCFMSIFNC